MHDNADDLIAELKKDRVKRARKGARFVIRSRGGGIYQVVHVATDSIQHTGILSECKAYWPDAPIED